MKGRGGVERDEGERGVEKDEDERRGVLRSPSNAQCF